MSTPRSSRFGLGPWEVDLSVGTAVSAEDVVSLTPTETRLLARLREAEGTPVSRDTLLREVWEYASTVRSRTVDTTLRRLRDKLEPDRHAPRLLTTHRGKGIALHELREARPLPSATRLVRRPEAPRLVGREDLLARVVESVEASPWVTLIGPSGAGKSALALAAADRWDDGKRAAVVVSITGCRHHSEVEVAVRRVIDGGRSERPLRELCGALSDPLLVLDDADALPPPEAEGVVELVGEATVLVTRQGALGLPHERRVRVGPLDEDATRRLASGLALQRDHTLSGAALQRIVEVSGGLPLAIELAVPIVAVAGVTAVEGAEWHALGADPSRTLRSALERSAAHLDDAARALLTELTAYSGAFDAHAAAALRPGALGPLMRLHERGLVAGVGEMHLLSPRAGRARRGRAPRRRCTLRCAVGPARAARSPRRPRRRARTAPAPPARRRARPESRRRRSDRRGPAHRLARAHRPREGHRRCRDPYRTRGRH